LFCHNYILTHFFNRNNEPIPLNAFDMVFDESFGHLQQYFEFNCKQLDEKYCCKWPKETEKPSQ